MRRAGDPPLRDATARLLFGDVLVPRGGSMAGTLSVSPFPHSRSRTTTLHSVRIPIIRIISAKQLLGAAVVALLCALAPAAAQAQAVSGRVIDATGKAISGAQVSVAGTGIRATADAEGRYRLTVSAAGAIALRVTAIGYTPQSKALTVAAGQSATVDFTLTANPVGLDAIIVTATGQLQKAREIPNDVTQVAAGDVEKAPVTNFADLLNARAAGVTVLPSSGTTGGGARVRIRGSTSGSLSNEPGVFIDGIRVNSSPSVNTIGVGGQV